MLTRLGLCGLCVVLAAAQAMAQEQREGPLSIGVLGGIAAGRNDGGATVGGTIGVDLSERLSIEGRALFLDRGRHENAAEATASLIVRLATDRKVAPYAAIGGGVYHATYAIGAWERLDAVDEDDWNRMMGGAFGRWIGRDPVLGNRWPLIGQMPVFAGAHWGDFLDDMRIRRGGSSTDPAFSFGGGVDIAVTPSLYVRPDFRGLMIFSDDTYTIGSATFSLGYRF